MIHSDGSRNPIRALLLFVLSAGLSLAGCTVVRAREAPDSGFIPHAERLAENRARAPFHRYWVADPVQYERERFALGRVYVAPVDTHFAQLKYDDPELPPAFAARRREEIDELGRYFRERIRLALSRSELVRAADSPNSASPILILRLALVDVVPTDPGVNIVATAASFLLPGGGLAKIFGEGSVAMEGVVEESRTEGSENQDTDASRSFSSSMEWEAFKDREGQKVSAFSVKDYQQYAHIRGSLDEWADQIATLFNTAHDVTVEEGDLVSVDPF